MAFREALRYDTQEKKRRKERVANHPEHRPKELMQLLVDAVDRKEKREKKASKANKQPPKRERTINLLQMMNADRNNHNREKEYSRALREEQKDRELLARERANNVPSEETRLERRINLDPTNDHFAEEMKKLQQQAEVRERVRRRAIRHQYLEKGRPQILVPTELKGQDREDYIKKHTDRYNKMEQKYGKYK